MATSQRRKNARIIVLDDDEVVSEYLALLLEIEGYEVVVKNNPVETVAFFNEHPDDFDLVVTDQMMPGLTGDQVAREMLKLRPQMPVLLVTGFSKKVTAENAESFGLSGFFTKPVNESLFLDKISDLLGSHAVTH